jgi:hypothetical protein
VPIKHLKYKNDEELINNTPNSLKNCSANDENLEQLENWLNVFLKTCKIDTLIGLSEDKIIEIEKRLGANLPLTLRLIYTRIGNNENILSPRTENGIIDYRLLNINELILEKGVIVYDYYSGEALYETDVLIYGVTGKSENLFAVDLNKNWHLNYHKKWYWEKDHMPLYKNIIVLLVCIAISNKNNIFKTNIKNVFSSKPLNAIDEKFSGYLERFKDFKHYNHSLYYNVQYGALGWLRAGNSSPELLMGCDDTAFVDKFISKYEFNKIKKYK